MFALRPATSADQDFLFALYASTRADEIAAWGWEPAAAEQFLRFQWDAQRRHYVAAYPGAEHSIVCVDGEPVGRLIVWESEHGLRLIDIALLPAVRGRGIGAALLEALQQRARAIRRPLRLQVTPENPALRLYRRLGFTERWSTATGIELEWIPGDGR